MMRLVSQLRAALGLPWDRDAMAQVWNWNKLLRSARAHAAGRCAAECYWCARARRRDPL